jgi:hypothetical protein
MIRGAGQGNSSDAFLHDLSNSKSTGKSTGKHPANISININTKKERSTNGDWDHGLESTKSPLGYDKGV